MAQSNLPGLKTSGQSQLLIDELRSGNGVGLLHCIGCGEVIVLTSVYDYSRIGIYYPGKVLVNQGSLHIDITEQTAVQSIVDHHIQMLQKPQHLHLQHTTNREINHHHEVATN